MDKKWMKTGVVFLTGLSLVCIPFLHLLVVGVNLLAGILVLGLQAVLVRLRRQAPARLPQVERQPFVSIHVPAHNEPPELLKETLRSLSHLDWENYEVLVIDNNTENESLWRPIEVLCVELGPRFRFFHVEKMKGFKAGAMNYLLPRMNPATEYVFVLDADYTVDPDALQRGLTYFTDEKTGMVQFPQSYRNVCAGNHGVMLDFKHFFSGYMNMANRMECVPSTGTLSFISVKALKSVNGFGTDVITEDADLGLRLCVAGFRAVYAHETIGRGVMPHDLPSLKKQRWRWAFGNAQILKLNGRQLLLNPQLSVKQKLGFLAHLTAWFNFNLIPTLSLLLLLPLLLGNRMAPEHPYIGLFSGLTLCVWLLLRFAVFYYALSRDGHSMKEVFQGFATHAGLGWVYSLSWLKCIVDHRAVFVRTNKFLTLKMPDALRATLTEAILGMGLGVTFLALLAEGFVIAPLAALLTAITRFCIYWVGVQMRRTFELTLKLETDEAQKAAAAEDEILSLESTTAN